MHHKIKVIESPLNGYYAGKDEKVPDILASRKTTYFTGMIRQGLEGGFSRGDDLERLGAEGQINRVTAIGNPEGSALLFGATGCAWCAIYQIKRRARLDQKRAID